MEKNRKLYYILMGTAVVLLTSAYGVGFYVGKDSGYTQAEKKFEVEKKKLLRTIASLTPLSRPKPEEKVVVVNGQPSMKSEEEKPVKKQENKTEEQKLNKKSLKEEKQQIVKEKEPVRKSETKPQKEKTEKKNIEKKNYFIQVGIFRSEVNAKKLASKLKKKGISASVDKRKGYYRVKAGMFTKKEAETVLKKLKEMKLSGIIKRR